MHGALAAWLSGPVSSGHDRPPPKAVRGRGRGRKAVPTACEAAARHARWEKALQALLHVQCQGQGDIVTCSKAISACARGTQWHAALGLFGDMALGAVRRDVISYSAAISACERAEQWQHALSLLTQMQKQQAGPRAGILGSWFSNLPLGSKLWLLLKPPFAGTRIRM